MIVDIDTSRLFVCFLCLTLLAISSLLSAADKPNKKYYDPRECMRAAETTTVDRLEQSFGDLRCQNILGLGEMGEATNVLESSVFGPRKGGLPV